MFELTELTELPVIAGFVLFAMQYIKKIPPIARGRGKELLPILAIILGAAANVVYQIIFEGLPYDIADVVHQLVNGGVTGLTACGAFSFIKCTFMRKAGEGKTAEAVRTTQPGKAGNP